MEEKTPSPTEDIRPHLKVGDHVCVHSRFSIDKLENMGSEKNRENIENIDNMENVENREKEHRKHIEH